MNEGNQNFDKPGRTLNPKPQKLNFNMPGEAADVSLERPSSRSAPPPSSWLTPSSSSESSCQASNDYVRAMTSPSSGGMRLIPRPADAQIHRLSPRPLCCPPWLCQDGLHPQYATTTCRQSYRRSDTLKSNLIGSGPVSDPAPAPNTAICTPCLRGAGSRGTFAVEMLNCPPDIPELLLPRRERETPLVKVCCRSVPGLAHAALRRVTVWIL